jgi:hypothetical protein
MLSIAFDQQNLVLRVTVSGIFASEDMEELDRIGIEFVARYGQVRGIFDYTDVEAFAVPQSRLMQRAQQPSIPPERVYVASRLTGGEGARVFKRYQREAGQREAALVASIEEAYALLGLRNPRFEPVER